MEKLKDYSQNSLLALAVSSKSVIMFDVIMACLEQDLSSDEVSKFTMFLSPLNHRDHLGATLLYAQLLDPSKSRDHCHPSMALYFHYATKYIPYRTQPSLPGF